VQPVFGHCRRGAPALTRSRLVGGVRCRSGGQGIVAGRRQLNRPRESGRGRSREARRASVLSRSLAGPYSSLQGRSRLLPRPQKAVQSNPPRILGPDWQHHGYGRKSACSAFGRSGGFVLGPGGLHDASPCAAPGRTVDVLPAATRVALPPEDDTDARRYDAGALGAVRFAKPCDTSGPASGRKAKSPSSA
jgi:hypothetical protein